METIVQDFNVLVDAIMQQGLSYRLLRDVMSTSDLIKAEYFKAYSEGYIKPTSKELKYLNTFLYLLTAHKQKKRFIGKLNRYIESKKFINKQEAQTI